jgi:cystathionine beta-lyase family protein involved in aluminum resistance
MFTVSNIISNAEIQLKPVWEKFEDIKFFNQAKVLNAFKTVGVQNSHYSWVTGYGYDDLGKEKLDEVYALSFGAESALVRPHLVSGTHAITCAVFGNLSAGDSLICLGEPYDTLKTVYNKLTKKYNIHYQIIDPNTYDISDISKNPGKKIISIQRSRGYEWRDSLDIQKIQDHIAQLKSINPNFVIFVDNCYGEFTQTMEPSEIGADIMAGSLIKNPGGGIVGAGAYIAGREDFVAQSAEYATAPGIGAHGACMFDQTRLMLQGFFMAPMIVCEALKGMSLAGLVFQMLDYETIPVFGTERNDIIQAIKFNDRDKLIKLCQIVQKYSPMNSIFSPVPAPISGYDDEIIMASGSFIEGSSIELSCDGPLRSPYIAYLQGGLSWAHTKYVLEKIIEEL